MKKIMLIICMLLIGSISITAVDASEQSAELQITFGSNPLVVSPGTNGYLEVRISNIGSSTVESIDVTTKIYDPKVIESKGNWNVDVGDLDSGSSTTLLYEYEIVDDASPGLYQIVFLVETANTGTDIRQTQIIKVEDNAKLDIISVSPRSINIGTESTVTFQIENTGGSTVNNVLFTWLDNSSYILPIGGDNRYTIDTIKGYNSTNISIDVFADPSCAAGIYPLSITLQYYDKTGTLERVTSQVGLQIGGGTDFEVVVEDSSSSSTTLSVSNVGSNTASSVIIKIPDQPNYTVSGSGYSNIGNLDAGDYTLVTFSLSQTTSSNSSSSMMIPGGSGDFNFSQRPFDDSSMGDMDFSERPNFMNRTTPDGINSLGIASGSTLIVEISYTDLFGVRQTLQKEVTMSSLSSSVSSTSFNFDRSGSSFPGQTEESSSGLDSGTMYILIGVIGIILVISIIKFDKIKTIPSKVKTWKAKKHED